MWAFFEFSLYFTVLQDEPLDLNEILHRKARSFPSLFSKLHLFYPQVLINLFVATLQKYFLKILYVALTSKIQINCIFFFYKYFSKLKNGYKVISSFLLVWNIILVVISLLGTMVNVQPLIVFLQHSSY